MKVYDIIDKREIPAKKITIAHEGDACDVAREYCGDSLLWYRPRQEGNAAVVRGVFGAILVTVAPARQAFTFRVWGLSGHRQRESFFPSYTVDLADGAALHMACSDETNTNDYCEMTIWAESEEAAIKHARGQILDGAFENSRVGLVELLDACTGNARKNEVKR